MLLEGQGKGREGKGKGRTGRDLQGKGRAKEGQDGTFIISVKKTVKIVSPSSEM